VTIWSPIIEPIEDADRAEPDERDDRDGRVFRALADDGRRRLLDALFTRDGQSLQMLGAALPAMTRFGVMKHLAVLEQAGLVVTHRDGRSKLHYLNPVPIQEIADRWIGKYAGATTATLTELRRHLEPGSA
jgi:DNA-binding transcriptional ArsR family regulator